MHTWTDAVRNLPHPVRLELERDVPASDLYGVPPVADIPHPMVPSVHPWDMAFYFIVSLLYVSSTLPVAHHTPAAGASFLYLAQEHAKLLLLF